MPDAVIQKIFQQATEKGAVCESCACSAASTVTEKFRSFQPEGCHSKIRAIRLRIIMDRQQKFFWEVVCAVFQPWSGSDHQSGCVIFRTGCGYRQAFRRAASGSANIMLQLFFRHPGRFRARGADIVTRHPAIHCVLVLSRLCAIFISFAAAHWSA